ncbi:hypothetical protein FLL45_03755 [Aliikangiella marina]|uniref:Uncharacterized protein n=1 Tax=Aliikangiella marina TaxID=1712262 RepID=A0A545TIM5_9GAMM|nr:hypothetical protein [Aliikangiella marina]TQV77079.1 hypothetical protein FLL45_03755 [Aliikangiella marina]
MKYAKTLIGLTGLAGMLTLGLSVNTVKAQEIEETVLGMNVSGTKDLPNVLYIIPWKPNSGQVSPPEISRLVDEIYEPVDPEVFTKQVNFYYQLTSAKSLDNKNKKATQGQP